MESIARFAEMLGEILGNEADQLARETSFIQRQRAFSGSDFAQSLIFAWLQEPAITLCGLLQVLGRCKVRMSASALTQRFTPACATFFQRLLERISQADLQASLSAPTKLLARFSAVIIEDSTSISLPDALKEVWRGNGGTGTHLRSCLKLFVRWDVLGGKVWGPSLTDKRCNDHKSPLLREDLPVGSLYLADLGFFNLSWVAQMSQSGRNKRYVLTRLQPRVILLTRQGHRLNLRGLLPQREGEAREMGVLVGDRTRVPMRLIMVRVPPHVAQQRQEDMIEAARRHGRHVSEETLFLAGWTLLISNVPRRLLSISEALILLRVRWQIERLFRLWKEYGHIDEWRGKDPWRVLTEIYAKLCAMLIQQWFLHEGCWHDPSRSLVKAAQVIRRECGRVMMGLRRGTLEMEVHDLVEQLRLGAGCHVDHRKQQPGTAQLFEEGLPWLLLLT